MRRNHFFSLWLFLLCLLPALTFAQTLSRYEYWFDDNIDAKQWVSISGTDEEVTVGIDVMQLDDGIHKFSFRVKQSDGKYSAISSSLFLKTTPGEATRLEYWIDGDITTRKYIEGQSVSVGGYIVNDYLDLNDVTPGVHRLFLRGRSADNKVVSAVITVPILVKRSMSQESKVVYWIDDNYDQRESISFDKTLEVNSLDLNMGDNTKYPIGFHRLNMRVDLEGHGESTVFSDGFFKSPTGLTSQLEYWFDGDITTRQHVSGESVSDGGLMFNNNLDLNNVTPGAHRLFMRGLGIDRKVVSAVTSMPIIVKSKYNVENPEELKVTEYAYWIDNEEPTVVSVSKPQNIINQPLTLDTRKLSDGQHTLHVQFGNSADIWNAPYDTVFNKAHVNEPLIAANATVEDGVVTLKYTAIPFGQRYIVVRQYPSGTKRKVDDLKSTEYPAALQATDTPAPGTYTYYIEGIYTDADGQTQKVRSGDMAVTVEDNASNVEKGSFYGIVTIDGERFPYHYKFYTITINGQPIRETPYDYRRIGTSEFEIEYVPYGAELTIGIEYENYAFNNVTVIANENTCNKTYRFNSNSGDIPEEQLDNDAYDLSLTNGIALTPDAWEIGVHNKYKYTPWSGNIIVKAISKKVMDLYDKEAGEGVSLWYYLRHSNAGLDGGPNYKTVADTHISLDGNDYKTLTLDIIDIPKGYDDDDREFYVCIFSKKDGTDELKPLAGGERQTLTFNPIDYAPSGSIDDYLIDEYKQILRHLKKMKDWGDPFAFEINALGGKLDKIIENLGNGTIDIEGVKKDIIVNSSQGAGLLLSCFIGDVNDNIVEDIRRNGESMLGNFRISEGIREVCNTLESFYNLHEVDDNHKFLETFKLVMQVSDKLKKMTGIKYPAFEVYKSYFELADAMVDAIENFEVSVQGGDVYEKLVNGKGIYKIKVRKYTSDGSIQYFSPQDVNKQIRRITFSLTTETDYKSESKSYDVNTNGNELVITNVNFSPKTTDIYISPQVWMNIYWTNNRVTQIPMLEKHFAKQKDFNTQSPTMTVELQSETNMILERMANKLTIINQK